MNIIIVGCGKVGRVLVEQLNEAGNNVTVVDINADRVNDLANRYDVMGITGNGATHAVLKPTPCMSRWRWRHWPAV